MATSGEQYFELAVTAGSPRVAKDGLFACLCCENYVWGEPGSYEICNICGWQDDPVQETQPDLGGGANKVSLLQARENYRMIGRCDSTELCQ